MSRDVGEVAGRLENEENSFFNLSVTFPTSQLILQRYFRFSYVTSSSLTSPGKPSMPRDKISCHSATNVSIPQVIKLKNNSTLIISVHLYIKLGFVSVNGPRANYFVDALLITNNTKQNFLKILREILRIL